MAEDGLAEGDPLAELLIRGLLVVWVSVPVVSVVAPVVMPVVMVAAVAAVVAGLVVAPVVSALGAPSPAFNRPE